MILIIILISTVLSHDSNVPILTEEDYDKLPQNVNKFIMFYAPWCPHCIKILPTWERLSQEIDHVYTVNCEIETNMRYRFGIKGFPSLMFQPANSQIAYKFRGNRTITDMLEFSNGGWQKEGVEQILIQKDVDRWAMMFEEFKNPMVIGALLLILTVIILILVMCILDRKEEAKSKQQHQKKCE